MSAKRILVLAGILSGLLVPNHAQGAASLTVTPITWDTIGLDSNDITVGQNHFPVGARVCNTGTAADWVTATFVWDDGQGVFTGDVGADPYINLRPGTNRTLTSLLAAAGTAGDCRDAYFEVELTRSLSAYDKVRRYHITAVDNSGTASTPIPRQLYVEHFVSQARNIVSDMQLSTDGSTFTSVASGGSMTLLKGNTYWIKLVGSTATQGYEQIESFINFPNTIFQVLSTVTTYTAETSPNMAPPYDRLYGDACQWIADPFDLNYRSCLGTGKAGGGITVTYKIVILSVPAAPLANPEPLGILIFDYSGSSYHYNSDYGVSIRFATVVDPAQITIAKSFNPNPTNINGISVLTFTITNPFPAPITGVNFTDPLPTSPGAMVVASPTGAATSNCGTPTFSPAIGASSLSFSNGTVPSNGSCTVRVTVTMPSTGTYNNTSGNLFIGTRDTGNSANASLTVNTNPPAPPPVCGVAVATWNMGTGTAPNPPTAALGGNTSSATASYNAGTSGGSSSIITSNGNPFSAWQSTGYPKTTAPVNGTDPYCQFTVNASKYTSITLQFDDYASNNWVTNNFMYVWSVADTGAYSATSPPTDPLYRSVWTTSATFPANTTGTSSTSFRISATGANTTGATLDIDNVRITGCIVPDPPSIIKAFSTSPVAVNGVSTLTFTLSNPNLDSVTTLTGVTFVDALPPGLEVAATPAASTTCGGTPTWNPLAGATTLTFGNPAAATIPPNSSCTVQVNIRATTAGAHGNISGYVSSTNGGTNTTSTGYATATLTAFAAPLIEKAFSPDRIVAGTASTLTFTITNPNPNDSLTGVTFTDVFPVTPAAMTLVNLTTTNTCGGSLLDSGGGALNAGDVGIRLTGGTVSGGSSCTVSVNVTAAAAGSYPNTSGAVTASVAGGTDTASHTLTVYTLNPGISIKKRVGTSTSGPWYDTLGISAGSAIYYQFTVENTGDVAFTSFNVTDPTLAGTFGSPISCSWTTSNTPSTLPGLPVGTVTTDPTATCVVGPVTALTGTHSNSATAHGTYTTGTKDSSPDTAVYKTTALSFIKSVAEASFSLAGDLLHYSYLVTNSGFDRLAGPVTVTDDKVAASCPNVNTVGNLDAFLDPGESITCTATYTVTAGDLTAHSVTNNAFATTGGVNSPNDSQIVFLLPTRVYLADFRAYEELGQVVVKWETASEVNTVGFFLWRIDEATGIYEQINARLLPAMLSPPAGGIYRLVDSGALPGRSYRYLLEEVESNGARNTYGPFEARVKIGRKGAVGTAGDAGDHLTGYRRESRAVSQEKLNRLDTARVIRAAARREKAVYQGGRIKIPITRDGLYFIETARIAQLLGLPAKDAKRMLRETRFLLSSGGNAVAYLPAADLSGLFFFAQGTSSIYTRENVYWIAPGAGSLMTRVRGRAPAAVGPAVFTDTVHAEENRRLAAYPFMDPASDFWFWEQIVSGYPEYDTKSFAIETPAAAENDATASLTVSLQGTTDTPANPDHHVQVRVNGELVGEHRWNGTARQVPRWEFSQRLLHDGRNTIEVKGLLDTGAEWSLFSIDSFDLTYQRRFEAAADVLLLRGVGNPVVTVSGFSSPEILVLDLTDPLAPALNAAATIEPSGTGYRVSFVTASPDRRYLAVATRAAERITTAWAAPPSGVAWGDGADYVVIAPAELLDGAKALADYRAHQGHSTVVVDVDELMNEFNGGLSSPEAIRSFLTYASTNWRVPPRFVVLVGDATYDYRDNLGYGENLVPTMTVLTPDGLFTSDNVLADVNGDRVPEIAIGRLSVLTPDELQDVIVKIAAYESAGGNRVLMVADNPDSGGDFTADSDTLASTVPPGYEVKRIYLSELGAAEARRQLFAEMNGGTNLINYLGHASSDMLTAENLFRSDDVAALTNRGLPFVLCGMTCMLGEYGFPGFDSLNETLLLKKDGGAVAVWAPTGLSYNTDAKLLDGYFLSAAMKGSGTPLGTAILQAFRESQARGIGAYVFDLYNLQGDPALRLW